MSRPSNPLLLCCLKTMMSTGSPVPIFAATLTEISFTLKKVKTQKYASISSGSARFHYDHSKKAKISQKWKINYSLSESDM
jgi:hypothetical protein